jgi:hypothetical protein
MGWFSSLFKKSLASQMYERTALSDLAAIQQLPPAAQRTIAADVAKFINMASLSEALLEQFFASAVQERRQAVSRGASSSRDPQWAAAALKEAWCGAKLGRARGAISASASDAIVQRIEGFVFNPEHDQ